MGAAGMGAACRRPVDSPPTSPRHTRPIRTPPPAYPGYTQEPREAVEPWLEEALARFEANEDAMERQLQAVLKLSLQPMPPSERLMDGAFTFNTDNGTLPL